MILTTTSIDHGVTEALTAREQQVANAIARGLSNKQIAREFGISPETVKRHLASIYSKLSLRGRVDLAVHVIRGSGLRVPGSESGSVSF